ncbi:MAG: peptidoglycan DD-metalloendopeptidase family protein [Atribacterota bacterium]|nr:peptidoglycan DD-metalloendopeptidase family protein [Atribacterota bacterium]
MQYFYHPDHLGSASFVTNAEGAVCQHIQYLPFGELFVSQRNSEFDSRFKFTAKELDNETSYTYFGTRYYDSDLSVWLSVDPMSDKYPGLSPYIYCLNNPLMFVDPIGEIPWPILEYYNGADRKITSGMYRNSNGKFHGGIDLVHMTNYGSISGGQIFATHDGIVTQSGTSTTAGNWIQITNGNIRTTYMHMEDAPSLKVGDYVHESDPIGNVGNTGRSTGPHLHYQIEIFNTETRVWNKINPVVGNIQKVNQNMEVELIDPQKLIYQEQPLNGGVLPTVVIEAKRLINNNEE